MNENKFKQLWKKIRSIKHFELIVAGVFALIILIIYFSSFLGGGGANIDYKTSSMKADEYANYLENRLSVVLSEVDGAGKVSVMITLAGGMEYEYATNEEIRSNTNGSLETSTTTSSPIIINSGGLSTPIIVKEIYPAVRGVIVVSEGARSIEVRLELIKAVETALNVPTSNIQILVGKK